MRPKEQAITRESLDMLLVRRKQPIRFDETTFIRLEAKESGAVHYDTFGLPTGGEADLHPIDSRSSPRP